MARAQTVLQLYALTSFRNALLPIKFAAAIIIMFFLFYCNFLFYIYSMKKQVAFVVVSLFFSLFLFIISVCTSFLFKLNSHFFLSSLTSICGSAPVDDRMRTRPIVVCMRIANKQLFYFSCILLELNANIQILSAAIWKTLYIRMQN